MSDRNNRPTIAHENNAFRKKWVESVGRIFTKIEGKLHVQYIPHTNLQYFR